MKVVTFLLAFLSPFAQANYSCNGKVAHLGVASSGILAISNGYGVHRVCSLTDEHCKGWMTLAASAKLAGRDIKIYYQNSNVSASSACSSVGDWVTPADPVYFLELL